MKDERREANGSSSIIAARRNRVRPKIGRGRERERKRECAVHVPLFILHN